MSDKNLGAQITHITSFLPEKTVDEVEKSAAPKKEGKEDWFLAPKQRRLSYPDYSSAQLGAAAVEKLLFESGTGPEEIDLLLFSAAINDRAKVGIGAEVRKICKLANARIMQVDTGCTSFLSLLKTADALLHAGTYRRAVLLTVTEFISRLDDFRNSPKSAVLGDGASATLVERGPSSIIHGIEKVRGENFGLMVCEPKKSIEGRKVFTEENPGPLQIEFSRRMLRKLREDSIESVVDLVSQCIDGSKFPKEKINFFLCHQPNKGLMNEWRSRLGFGHDRVFDTFENFGNLFQGSIPISLAEGLRKNVIKKGDVIVCGTFSNGADFICSMLLRI